MTPAAEHVGFELIIPFIRPLEQYLLDPEVTEIMVNGGTHTVFIEKHGKLIQVPVSLTEGQVDTAINHIAGALNIDLRKKATLNGRLPDHSRVNGIRAGYGSVGGSALTIRKFRFESFSIQQLIELGTLDCRLSLHLEKAVSEKQNILICGATGSGKSTLINTLGGLIPMNERVVVIEETTELQLPHLNQVRLEVRQTDDPPITMRMLLEDTLRLRPDRIIVGEVRGAEAFEFWQAMNTGHQGTLCTIHANSVRDALPRMADLIMLASLGIDREAVLAAISGLVQYVLHLQRDSSGGRIATELGRVAGFEAGKVKMDSVWKRGVKA